jgi:hypothetical protein
MIYVRSSLAGIGALAVAGILYPALRNYLFAGPDVHVLSLPAWLVRLVDPKFILSFLRILPVASFAFLVFALGFCLELARGSAR